MKGKVARKEKMKFFLKKKVKVPDGYLGKQKVNLDVFVHPHENPETLEPCFQNQP